MSVIALLSAWSAATRESRNGEDLICLGVVRVRDVPTDWPCHTLFLYDLELAPMPPAGTRSQIMFLKGSGIRPSTQNVSRI